MKKIKNPERSRQTILAAALKEIQQKGFHTASLTDILDGTGLTRGALYQHFPNKKALGHSVLDEILKMVSEIWLDLIKNCNDPITRLQEVVMIAGSRLSDVDIITGCHGRRIMLSCIDCAGYERRGGNELINRCRVTILQL